MSDAHSYQLLIRLTHSVGVAIGGLGKHHWPAGLYVYTGSARKNRVARVARHLSQSKRLRWHIDYFLQHPAAQIIDVRFLESEECCLNQSVAGTILLNRFGASDCRHGCGSHLKYLGEASVTTNSTTETLMQNSTVNHAAD